MKFLVIFVFLFSACGIQRKSNLAFSKTERQQLQNHQSNHDSDNPMWIGDFIEFLFTGNFEHSHLHHDQGEDKAKATEHEHHHQHHSFISVVYADCMPEIFHFYFENKKLKWPLALDLNQNKSFQSELLRPPIYI